MPHPDDETRQLRSRVRALRDAMDGRVPGDNRRTPLAACKVFAEAAVPTSAGKFFACHPVDVSGVVPGGTAVFTADTEKTMYVDVLGPRVPVTGDMMAAASVGFRWVASIGVPYSPCVVCVQPRTPCGGLTGATVTVYHHGATDGAFIDDASNDTVVATGVTDSTGYFCANVSPGVYMMKVESTGYQTVRLLAYACISGCAGLGAAEFSLGNSATINTSGKTTTCVCSYIIKLDPVLGYIPDLGQPPLNQGYNTFSSTDSIHSVRTHPYDPFNCTLSAGTNAGVFFRFGCPGDGLEPTVFYDTFAFYYAFHVVKLVDPGSDALCVGMVAGNLSVAGTVTSVELSPFRVTGSWATTYSLGSAFESSTDPTTYDPVALGWALPALPVSGGFVIE